MKYTNKTMPGFLVLVLIVSFGLGLSAQKIVKVIQGDRQRHVVEKEEVKTKLLDKNSEEYKELLRLKKAANPDFEEKQNAVLQSRNFPQVNNLKIKEKVAGKKQQAEKKSTHKKTALSEETLEKLRPYQPRKVSIGGKEYIKLSPNTKPQYRVVEK